MITLAVGQHTSVFPEKGVCRLRIVTQILVGHTLTQTLLSINGGGGLLQKRLSYHRHLFLSINRTVGPRKAKFQNVNLIYRFQSVV